MCTCSNSKTVKKKMLTVTARKLVLLLCKGKINLYFVIVIFWVGVTNCEGKNEECISYFCAIVFPESQYVNSHPDSLEKGVPVSYF